MVHVRLMIVTPRVWLVLFGFIACIALPNTASACTWNVSGMWKIWQGNQILVTFNLKQTGTVIRGTASYGIDGIVNGMRTKKTVGNVYGTMQGADFKVTVNWSTSPRVSRGLYEGRIGGGGRLAGFTRDLQSGAGAPQVPWQQSTSGNFRCT